MGLFAIEIVLLENDPNDIKLIERCLGRKPKGWTIDYHLKTFTSLEAGRRYLSAGGTDLILLDLNLNGGGIATFRECREMAKGQPILILSGHVTPEIFQEAIQEGAYHCLDKNILKTPNYFHLTLLHAVERARYRYHLDRLQRTLTNEFRDLIGSCAVCHRWRVESTGQYIAPEEYIKMFSKANFTHGVCEDCAKSHYKEFMPK